MKAYNCSNVRYTAIIFVDPKHLYIASITTLDEFGEFCYACLGFVKAARHKKK